MTRKNLNRRQMIAAGVSATMAPAAFAQFGKKKSANADGVRGTAAADGLLPAGTFVKYIALASDLGTQGTMQLLTIYPPEKIEQIKKACEVYAEARRQNKGGEPNAETMKLCSNALESASALAADVAELNDEKKKALAAAHKKVNLMLLADAFAALNAPAIINRLNSDIQSISSNPMKAGSILSMKSQLQFLTFAALAFPGQIKAATTIRDVAKKIADAQKVKLAEPPPDKSVNTIEGFQSAVKSDDV